MGDVTNATHCNKLNEFICQKSYIDPSILLSTGMSTGATILTVIIVILLVAALIFAIIFIIIKKKKDVPVVASKLPT